MEGNQCVVLLKNDRDEKFGGVTPCVWNRIRIYSVIKKLRNIFMKMVDNTHQSYEY